MSRQFLTLVICAVALLPVSLASQPVSGADVRIDQPALTRPKIRPGDGSERDPAFARVRQALLSATRRNDLDAVIRYFAPDIVCFPEVGGAIEEATRTAAACAARLRADPDEARAFLSNLQDALEAGTAFDHDMIVAPYVAVATEIVQALPQIVGFYYVVAAEGVRARSAPGSRAPVVEVLSYDIVTLVTANADAKPGKEGDTCDAWMPIVTPSKRGAWICAKYLFAPLDLVRFDFQRQPDGEWRLAAVYVPD